ncbi:thiol-disulfide oxidoreductase DCC family protein [Paenibacillus radicis (ex Xue et al. 2023)]|uniref:Thiol-disulfide oxidoreductase DCC family protein n=1 Tax=Paenibacillus radicis (ex Xue et al. 2023) TaxID=2972489 RepID=A0ABT1YGF5_9BACL|nr:thiol-disulfide oxidoreductase DCC family protein [Paenibacillus radicis (ex Xue et al. 2023)]MCR8632282.1 thiol-disulfide oxidoreductase DCC family protein [Paenibacillus radicis (ex Xue et al. 2023)]
MIDEKFPKHEHSDTNSYSIVLFDGVCRFCNGWVQFLIRQDKADVFRFSPIQSDYAQSLLDSTRSADTAPDSVILVEKGVVYTRSSAVLHIFKRLGRYWALFYLFTAVPRPLRDAVYRWIAKRRYKLFGKYDSCMMPTENVKRKFIG